MHLPLNESNGMPTTTALKSSLLTSTPAELPGVLAAFSRFDVDQPDFSSSSDSGGSDNYGGDPGDPFHWHLQPQRPAYDFNASDMLAAAVGISASPSDLPSTRHQPQRAHHSYPAAFLLDDVPYGSLLNGYIVPLLVLVTIITNLLVCLVLNRPHMRTATNAVLVAIALSDSLTGLWPLPSYVYFYALGAKSEYVPYRWCYAYFCLTEYLPTVFHTTSVWLTVLLAAHRYVCVCRGDLPSAGNARRRSVVVKVIFS